MRLIDADALQEEYVRLSGRELSLINDAPTVDAVEVIRCKDCFRYWKGNGVCDAHVDLIDVDDDCYCSWGERK